MKIKIILFIVVALAVISFIPFNTTVAPEWKIQVVDEIGQPYRQQRVRQFCRSYSLQTSCEEIESDQYTDDNGYAKFPKRTIRLSLVMRAFNFLLSLFQSTAGHASFETVIRLNSTGPQGYETLKYDPDKPLPDKFVLPSKPE